MLMLSDKAEKALDKLAFGGFWSPDSSCLDYLEIVESELRDKDELLGEIENVTKDLGCDALTLLKLVTHGCYVWDEWNGEEERKVEHFCFFCLELGGFLARYNLTCDEHYFAFEDYGQTWALTKEELL